MHKTYLHANIFQKKTDMFLTQRACTAVNIYNLSIGSNTDDVQSVFSHRCEEQAADFLRWQNNMMHFTALIERLIPFLVSKECM